MTSTNRLAMVCAVAAITALIFLVALAFGENATPCPSGDVLLSPRVMDLWTWGSSLIEPHRAIYAVDVDGVAVGKTMTVPSGDGTAAIIMHIYGDYPNTPEDEGLEAGEIFWFIYNYGDGYCADIRLATPPRFENFGCIELIETAALPTTPCPQIRILPPGDITGDGTLSVLDFVQLGSVVFRGADLVPGCDVTGDGQVTILDVARLADVVFRGGDPGVLRW